MSYDLVEMPTQEVNAVPGAHKYPKVAFQAFTADNNYSNNLHTAGSTGSNPMLLNAATHNNLPWVIAFGGDTDVNEYYTLNYYPDGTDITGNYAEGVNANSITIEKEGLFFVRATARLATVTAHLEMASLQLKMNNNSLFAQRVKVDSENMYRGAFIQFTSSPTIMVSGFGYCDTAGQLLWTDLVFRDSSGTHTFTTGSLEILFFGHAEEDSLLITNSRLGYNV